MDEATLTQWLPVGISALSLMLASLALGWNIYRDIVLRAQVRVSFSVVKILSPGIAEHGTRINIRAVNHGPGPVNITGISGRTSPLWRTILRRPKHFIVLPDQTNPLSDRLPKRLEVGETLNLFLPYNKDSVLGTGATHIGVNDSFGRQHFAPASELRIARRGFEAKFGPREPGELD